MKRKHMHPQHYTRNKRYHVELKKAAALEYFIHCNSCILSFLLQLFSSSPHATSTTSSPTFVWLLPLCCKYISISPRRMNFCYVSMSDCITMKCYWPIRFECWKTCQEFKQMGVWFDFRFITPLTYQSGYMICMFSDLISHHES